MKIYFINEILFEIQDFSSGYQVIIDKEFGSSANCMPEYQNQWLTYQYLTINQCTLCTNVSTGTSSAIIPLSTSQSGVYFREFAANVNQPYSIVGVDIIYAQVNNVQLRINLNLQLPKTFNSPVFTLYEQTDQINCGGPNIKFQKASVLFNGSLSPYNSYVGFTFDQHSNPFYIKQVMFWTNCCLNCETCASSNQCLICMKGFKKYQFSGGQTVCEQTQQCTVSNCFSCAKYGGSEDCITCLPGYYLDGSGNCVDYNPGSPCHTSSTYLNSSLQCKNYNTVCYYQDPTTLILGGCGNKENYQTYKCPENKQVIIYRNQNYGVYQCGCNIDNCKYCSTANVCDTCETGFTYNSGTKQCVSNCATNQYYDVGLSTCRNCGTNCATCNSQNCLTCNSSTQYITASTPQNCATCTVANCQTCAADGKCSICATGYFTSSDRSTCNIECTVPNCITCISGSGTQCQTCQVNFVKNGSNQCICNIAHCDVCDLSNGNNCQQCTSGYTLNASKKCDCSVSNCGTCNASNGALCDACSNSYALSTDHASCNCDVSNCNTCVTTNGTQCQTCQNGYLLNSTTKQCDCQVVNCQTGDPTDGTKCNTCVNNYLLSGNKATCSCQVSNCTQCQTNDGLKCQTCVSGYTLNPTTKLCECPVQNCQTCNASNTSLCDTCIYQYLLSANFMSCTCQASNCNVCLSNDGSKCQTCKNGYTLNAVTNQCQCSVQNCQTCNSANGSLCDTCINQYSQSVDHTQCTCQATNCNVCLSNDGSKCQTCKNGYTLNLNQCQCSVQNCQTCNSANGSLCDTCVNQYLQSVDHTQCTCQASNCNVCLSNDGSKCQTCKNGYTLNVVTSQCECSVQNCQTCNSANGSLCDACVNQYLQSVDHTQCTCQAANCNQCQISDGQQCSTCKSGYLLNISNQCQCQVANCSQCQINNGLQCQTCQSGYLLNGSNQCDCQVANCTQCQSNNGQQCQTCKSGYLLNGTNQCDCQVANCSQCKTNDGLQCQTCQSGYLLNGSNQCDCQVSNCSTCKINDGLQCQSCQTGYLQNVSNQCDCQVQNCLTCKSINGNQCQTCQIGYILNLSTFQCECGAQNCLSCSQLDGNVCLTCQNNYQLNNVTNQCETNCTIKNCQNCLGNQKCDNCETGYEVSQDETQCIRVEINANKYKVTVSVINSGYKIKIDFDEKLINSNINDNIQEVKLSIIGFMQYSYEVTKSDDSQLIAIVNSSQNIKYAKVQIDFQTDQFVMDNHIFDIQHVEDLPTFVVISEEDRDKISKVTTVAQGVSTTLISGFLPLAILGNFYFLVNMIDLTSFLYYLTFLDIRYPINVTEFYALFKDFQFPFIPNFFSNIIQNGYTQPGPKKFMDMGVDCYLISNSGQSMTICFCVTGLYIFVKICQKVIPNRWLHQYLSRIIYETWEYGAFFDMMSAVYIYILIGSLLQTLYFNFDDQNTYILNYTLYAFWMSACIWVPLHLTHYLLKQKNLKNNKHIQVKLSSFISGLVIDNEDFYCSQTIQQKQQKQMALKAINKESLMNHKKQKSQNMFMNDELKINGNGNQAQNEITKKNPLSSDIIQELEEEQGISPMLQKGPQLFNNKRPRQKILNLKKSENQNDNFQNQGKINRKNDDFNLDLNEKFNFGQSEIYQPDESSEQNNNSIQDIDTRTKRQKYASKYSKMCSSFLYIRKIFFGLIIVFLYGRCYLQLALLLCLSTSVMLFIIYIQPYDKTSENIKNGAAEAVLIVIEISAYFLVEDGVNESEDVRLRIGWVIVICSGFVLLWNAVILAKDTLLSLYDSIKKLYQKNFHASLKRQSVIVQPNKQYPSKVYNSDNLENQENLEHQDSIIYEKNKNKEVILEDAQTYGKKSSSSLFSSNGLLMRRKRVSASSRKTSASNSDIFSLNQQSQNSFRPSTINFSISPRTDNVKQIESNENNDNDNFKLTNLDYLNHINNQDSINLDIQDVQMPSTPQNSHASPQKIIFSIQNELKMSSSQQLSNQFTPTRRRRGSQNAKALEKRIYNKSTFTEYNNIKSENSTQQ